MSLKITTESIEKTQRWSEIIAPTLPETLRRLRELQRREEELQVQACLKNEYYDLDDEQEWDLS